MRIVRWVLFVRLIGAGFFALLSIPSPAQVGGYFLDPIPAPAGTTSVGAVGINDKGAIAATLSIGTSTGNFPALLDTPTAVLLPGIAGNNTLLNGQETVTGLNNLDAVVGNGPNASSQSRAIYWDANHSPWELEPLAAGNFASTAQAISDNWIVVGKAETGGTYGPTHATMWVVSNATPNANPTDLGTCPSLTAAGYDNHDGATAISPNGQYIVGTCFLDIGIYGEGRGARWSPTGGVVLELNYSSNPRAVNNSGLIVGSWNQYPDNCPGWYRYGCPAAVTWNNAGETTFLPVPAGYNMSSAAAVNGFGVIVGQYGYANPNGPQGVVPYNAAIWAPPSMQMTDLNKLFQSQLPAGFMLDGAYAISDGGKVLVSSYNPSANISGPSYQLTPAIPTRVTISARDPITQYRQQVLLSAGVIPASGAIAAGQVNWYANGKFMASSQLNSSGVAAYHPSHLEPGSYTITAKYLGKSPDATGTSPPLRHTVVPSTTRTSLASSTAAPLHGAAFTLTARVVASYGTVAGTVTFYEGTRSVGSVLLNSTGVAKKTITVPTVGLKSFSAAFVANSHFAASHSGTFYLTIR